MNEVKESSPSAATDSTGIFEPGQINYILRTYLPHWRYEERIEEMVRFCRETGTRHVMLFSDAQLMAWNQLTLEEAQREAANIRKAKERLAQEGIRVGINSTYNMRPSRWDHRKHNDYDFWATYADGSGDYRTPCLLDPKLDTYLERFYTVLAEVRPDYIYVDDDHRYMLLQEKDTWGCFCDLHLRRFGEITGKAWTRKRLLNALMNRQKVRNIWVDFLGERLVQIGRIISTAIHAVDPTIEVGLMTPCIHPLPLMGHTIVNVLETFRGARKPLVRPCIGPYSDRDRRQIIPGLFYMEYAGHLLGDTVEYTPEIETGPFTRFSKSMTVVRFHITQGILNRMNNPAISACGYVGDSPYFEPAFVPLLAGSRNYFEAVREIAPERGTRKGVQFIWDFRSVKYVKGHIGHVTDLYWPSFSCHDVLGNMGFPHTYDESPVRLLAGESVAALSKERIKEILRGGLILEANAAKAFMRRGFSDLIGCSVGENPTAFAAEEGVSQKFLGPYVNTFIPLAGTRLNAVYELKPVANAQVISRITDHDRREIAPGVVLFENRLGGKIAVLPYSILGVENDLTHLICYQRRYMLEKVLRWMSPDVLALFVEEPTDFAVQVWDNGERLTCCITNLSYDLTSDITVRFSSADLKPAKARFVDDDGRLCPLQDAIEALACENGTRWRIRGDFLIFKPFVMIVDR